MEAFARDFNNVSSFSGGLFGNESSSHSSTTRLVMKLKEDGFLDYTGFELDSPPIYLPYSFEIVDWKGAVTWTHAHYTVPLWIGLVYLTLIFGVQAWMKGRAPYSLKTPLFLWNATLGLFSIIGFARMAPEFFGALSAPNGFYSTVCVWQGGNMPTAFWGLAFTWSKIIELGDTVFIVLRKRPLQVLQWYHHLVTLSVCWWTLPYVEPIARYYCVMNYGVHSLMYPYFAGQALGLKIPRGVANLITTLQLGQMLLGLGVNTWSAFLFAVGGPESCFRHPNSVKMFFLVYGSFAVLFGQLFWRLVVKKARKTGTPPTERVKEE